jgi:chromosome segregation ATPase
MARIGITKKQVKTAKNSLLARKAAITIDAVRQELGNTGSKTTISRYLNELAEEERETPDSVASLSEELEALVTNIANRLQSEANEVVEQSEVRHQEEVTTWQEKCVTLEGNALQSQEQVSALTAKLSQQESVNQSFEEKLNTLKLAQAQLVEKEAALQQRLAEKQTHIDSLEDKHAHAREALAHFREAAKAQREQEQQRHEHQLQQVQVELRQANQMLVIKQDELTNKARALSTLETAIAVRDSKLSDTTTQMEKLKNQLEDTLVQLNSTQSTLTDREKHYADHDERLHKAESASADLRSQVENVTQENIELNSTLRAKEELLNGLMQVTKHSLQKSVNKSNKSN